MFGWILENIGSLAAGLRRSAEYCFWHMQVPCVCYNVLSNYRKGDNES